MAKPKIIRVLNIGLLIAVVVSALSFLIKIVPCRFTTTEATGFGLCRLPSIFSNISELSHNYYGISNNPLTGLVFQFIIIFIIVSVVFYLFRRRT